MTCSPDRPAGAEPSSSAPFDPWTATEDEARAATGGDTIEVGEYKLINPAMSRWYAARYIGSILRPRIENEGDTLAILEAMAECAENGLVAPDWLAKAFIEPIHKVLDYKVGSIDEAFGHPFKGKRVADLRRQREMQSFLWLGAREFLRQHPDRAIDPTLWDDVATFIGKTFPEIVVTGAMVDRACRRARKQGLQLKGASPRRW